ncbi:hypothetical protein IC575_002129 [Cucumis melo]
MPASFRGTVFLDLTELMFRPIWLLSGSKSCFSVSNSIATIWFLSSPSIVSLVRPIHCPQLCSGTSTVGAIRKASPSPAFHSSLRKILM